MPSPIDNLIQARQAYEDAKKAVMVQTTVKDIKIVISPVENDLETVKIYVDNNHIIVNREEARIITKHLKFVFSID